MVDLRDPPPIDHPNAARASQIARKPVVDSEQPQVSPVSPLSRSSHGQYEAVSTEESGEARDEAPYEKGMAGAWPTSQRLRRKTVMTYVFVIWDVILTLLPVVFLVFAACARALDKQPLSEYGHNIIKGSAFGPTVFPIVFAAIVGRFMKGIALRRSERGTRLGMLEQLIGSQSLAGSVERWIVLRRFNLIGISIVVLWLLSPLGGQSSLRILSIIDSYVLSEGPVHYFNASSALATLDVTDTVFEGADSINTAGFVVSSLLTASLLASEKVLKSPVDQWNNVKIPRLDQMSPFTAQLQGNPWITVNNIDSPVWTSLSGLMIVGPPANGTSNFTVETSYVDFACADSVNLTAGANQTYKDAFAKIGITSLSSRNTTSPFQALESFFLDTSDTNNFNIEPNRTRPLQILYGSRLAEETDSFELYVCDLMYPKVEANITCQGLSCAVTHLRRSETDLTPPYIPPFDLTEMKNLMLFLPGSAGVPHDANPSPIDQYMLGSDSPFAAGLTPIKPDFSTTPGTFFAKRLGTIINTVWQAGVCPYTLSLGSTANFSTNASDPSWVDNYVPTANTKMTVSQQILIYQANHAYVGILLVVSLILLGCAVAAFILNRVTTAPDILGYVSTMTRDNPFTDVPPGGTALDGLERARYLADMKVQLADVSDGKAEGHIALRSVTDSDDFRKGGLSRNKLYH